MDTKIKIISGNNIDEDVIKEAGAVIKAGGLVAFPTETVYGLGANALSDEAVKKIFKAKGRPQDNPLIVHIADIEDVYKFATDITHISKSLMNKFWPGPLTIILKKSKIIPYTTSAGLDTVGIRMPKSIIARKLIKAAKVPIAAPSANLSGKPSPTDVERCIEDLKGKIEYIIGEDICEVGLESTIVDCTVNPPCVLRPGGITLEMLKEVDSSIYIDKAILKGELSNVKPKAPGMKYRHYAPKAEMKIISGNFDKTIDKINDMVHNEIIVGKKVGIIATEESKDKYEQGLVISIGSRKNINQIGRNLFETLRIFDDEKVDIIFSESFEEIGFGIAIMNRLKKAAGYNIINI